MDSFGHNQNINSNVDNCLFSTPLETGQLNRIGKIFESLTKGTCEELKTIVSALWWASLQPCNTLDIHEDFVHKELMHPSSGKPMELDV